MARKHLSVSTVCGRHAHQGEGRCSRQVLPSAAVDTWQAIASGGDAPSSGRHARRDAARSLSGLVQRVVELVLGILHAVHRRSGCGQRSLDVASKAEKANVLQQQGVAMQPFVHHASACPAIGGYSRRHANQPITCCPKTADSPTPPRDSGIACQRRGDMYIEAMRTEVRLVALHTPDWRREPDFLSTTTHWALLSGKTRRRALLCDGWMQLATKFREQRTSPEHT
jgi:hypothetical protein